jgi:hypothetical protein
MFLNFDRFYYLFLTKRGMKTIKNFDFEKSQFFSGQRRTATGDAVLQLRWTTQSRARHDRSPLAFFELRTTLHSRQFDTASENDTSIDSFQRFLDLP